jgi:hypothetical protein
MDVFVATFEDRSGCASVEIFKTRKEANTFLRTIFKHCYPNGDVSFKEWQTYGGFTCRVWKRKI